MRLHRLSYVAAGAAPAPTHEPPARPSAPPRIAPVPERSPSYARTPAQARQRRVVVIGMVGLHLALVGGLLAASRLQPVSVEAAPLFVAVVDAPAPVSPPRALPPPPSPRIPPPPLLAVPVIALESTPAPSPVIAAVQPPPPAAPAAAPAPAEAPPAPAPAPRTIPAAAVQYLVPPAPVYSRVSARMREAGKAVIRVFIDEAGLPRQVQLAASTGFARLDEAALAAVRDCRFRPYLENGVAVAGWASIPIEFELPT